MAMLVRLVSKMCGNDGNVGKVGKVGNVGKEMREGKYTMWCCMGSHGVMDRIWCRVV